MMKKIIINFTLVSLLTLCLCACTPPMESDTPPEMIDDNINSESVVYRGEEYSQDDLVYRGEEYEITTLPYYSDTKLTAVDL